MSSCHAPYQKHERGNALLIILIVIVLLAALTMAIEQDSTGQSGTLPQQTSTDQINRMITYASALGGALQQMVTNGENPNTLAASLVTTSSGFTTEAHDLEIFHPLGGGITYMSASSPDTSAVATSYSINKGSSVTGVGCTPGTTTTNTVATGTCAVGACTTGMCTTGTGHIIFTALISSASYCEQINNIVTGSSLTTVPSVMTSTDFTNLFTTTTAVTVGSDCTPTCANIPRLCVSNTGATSWGFYADLFPPQWTNTQ